MNDDGDSTSSAPPKGASARTAPLASKTATHESRAQRAARENSADRQSVKATAADHAALSIIKEPPSRRPPPPPPSPVTINTTIYVGNLPAHVTATHVEKLLSKFGPVIRVHRDKTFAFGEFATPMAAQAALVLHGRTLARHVLLVRYAHQRNQSPSSYYAGKPTVGASIWARRDARITTTNTTAASLDAKIAAVKRQLAERSRASAAVDNNESR